MDRTISSKLQSCSQCHRFDGKVAVDKPFLRFLVEEKWRPSVVKVLFVAESPPWDKERYFYKQDMTGNNTNLQKELFRYLNLNSLDGFKAKGYYLIDAVKCRLNKRGGKEHIPQEIIATCGATFLLDEIKELKPSAIFVLGNSAKKALQNLPPFSDLASHKVTEDYDKVLCGIRVILCVYPGGKTRGHMDSIKKAFSKIS
jgi:uracil-DNA glycosylase